jgi:endonuclease/exonuclease/phosphatase family metal-dependent hydrolase
MTYNIQHGLGVDGKVDIARIGDLIKKVNPDIVGLQEVDRFVKRSGRIDQTTELSRLTEMRVVFAATIKDYQGGDYGIAVLSKYPIIEWHTHSLPSLPEREDRLILQTTVELENGQKVAFINTHWGYVDDLEIRKKQAELINALMQRHGQKTMILVGDLNVEPDSEAHKMLSRYWSDSVSNRDVKTYPSPQPIVQIDHIFYRPVDRVKIINYEIIDDRVASDHRPIVVTMEVVTE